MEKQQNQDLNEMLQELRVALPGVQMLFAFLLTIPFAQGFEKLGPGLRWTFFAALLFTTASCVMLIAPSVYHRLHWRREVEDQERMLQVFNVLAISGSAFLCAAIVTSISLITRFVFGVAAGASATVAIALGCITAWYVLPLIRRAREKK